MSQKPNILLIITEQHRGDCLGIDGHPVLQTPNLDHLAAQGARFGHAFTSCASCIAARRSLLSGQFPATHRMVGYRDGVEWEAPPTLPQALSVAGYHTCWVGRSMHQHPPRKRYGFNHMVTHDDYREWLAKVEPEGSGGYFGTGVMHNDWTARPWHMEESFHDTNWTVNQALEFLHKRDPSCPFFLVVSFIAAHPPLIPPAFYMERYLRMEMPEPPIGDWAVPPENDGLGQAVDAPKVKLAGEALRSCQAGYYGLINHVDDQLRRLFCGRTAPLRNTIIVFLSDHGEMLGDHYLFRKTVPYQGSSRIPFLINLPQSCGGKSGLVCDQVVCLEDIMPTLLEAAEIPIPETVEGRSILPLLRGEQVEWQRVLHLEHAPIHHSLTDGKRKFVWLVAQGPRSVLGFQAEEPAYEQFFDLSQDPQECRNLIDHPEYAEEVEHWRQLLITELEDRPEGFSDGKRLIPVADYPALLGSSG